jgi:hypothetical protein
MPDRNRTKPGCSPDAHRLTDAFRSGFFLNEIVSSSIQQAGWICARIEVLMQRNRLVVVALECIHAEEASVVGLVIARSQVVRSQRGVVLRIREEPRIGRIVLGRCIFLSGRSRSVTKTGDSTLRRYCLACGEALPYGGFPITTSNPPLFVRIEFWAGPRNILAIPHWAHHFQHCH